MSKRKMMMAREVKTLFELVLEAYRKEFPGDYGRVTNSVLFAYAFKTVKELSGYTRINWPELARMKFFETSEIDCPDLRYGTSLTLPVALYPAIGFGALEDFRKKISSSFEGIRRNCYLPFCVRLILRAFIANQRNMLPLLCDAPFPSYVDE